MQDKYKQLEDILNKCIGLWWKPRWGDIRLSETECRNIISFYDYDWYNHSDCSYCDIFSKDSGLMEFVSWKQPLNDFTCTLYHFYSTMSMMTSEEKIEYFISNVILPN